MAASGAATTNIMLAIYEKKTTTVDLYRPLRNYITFTYSEREAQNLEDDLQTLKELRLDVERVIDPSPAARRDVLQSYFKVLCLVETRFPISPDSDHINTVTFTWHDAFKQKQKASQQNIHLEKAAVLFNLGAAYSQLGLSFDRTTVEGRRQASHAFIGAAGAFAFLRDNAATKASMDSSTTVDVSVVCAGMLERLMLAQAQECVFENTIAKGSTPGVCSKICRQVGLYYEEALTALNVAPLKDHFDKGWISHVQLKAVLFYSEACYRYSLELHEKEEIAEEIAQLRSGVSALAEAKKSSKGAAAQLLDAMSKLGVNLSCNLERAVKENDRVYLMRVPSPSSLPPLPAFSLVKPMAMNEVLDASKKKMFASLVPDSSAKALSRYTEMVDDIIRTQAEKLQQGSELTRVGLKEMDLPDSIRALEGSSLLPADLKEDVEAVQISGGPAGLESELQQLRDLRGVNQELLVQTEELLQKEAAEDAQFRSQFRTRWTRPQSSTLTKNLQDRLNRFAANLKQAADSDARIERSVRDHSTLMSILDRRPIENALPTLARPIMSLDANEDAVVGSLKQSLRQLETLGAQRAGLEDMLKEMKRKDDILPKLMTSTGSYEDLFRKEIAKYDHICEEISQNIEAQEQLLMQIQAQNDEFSSVFNLEDFKASREKCYKQIQAAIAKYREINENINEGLKFYVTLRDAIANVKQQCSDYVMTRNIQCREMMEDVQRQMAGLGFQDRQNMGSHNYLSFGQPPQTQRSSSLQPSDPQPGPPCTQSPYYQPPEQPTMPGYGHPHLNYGSNQHPPPYHIPPASGSPYPPPQPQQQPPTNHDYGQPAYPGWQGPYYNAPQPGSFPRPPYTTVPSPYPPPNQSGYYKQ
ncbi:ALG-2 interacting protein X [Tripterygium wilfordii]|uniref:ALG-2 interacting protein X n=1 Tax=Tripterygium wilfordii TaxID=458696 RepID=A0A7J7DFS3_TRIWF|nr:vacuolar-sorting protein BRO1-like [Tripterygium wilfordii]KAF5745220.1 ALG-2 interacting protein X [Tripterygium wilfordii]